MRTRILPLIAALLLVPAALAAAARVRYIRPGPVRMDAAREKWAARTLRKLTVEEKVGQLFMVWARARVPDLNTFFCDPRTVPAVAERALKAAEEAQVVLIAAYLVPTAGGPTDTTALSESTGSLFRGILDRGANRTIVLAMGNPYVAQGVPGVRHYLCAFSNTAVSEISAVKALFGEIPIRGHLPVTIPGIAARGTGIERPAAP